MKQGVQRYILVIVFAVLASTIRLAAQEQPQKALPDRTTGAVDSSQMVRLVGNVHPNAQPQFDQGVVNPGFQLRYMTLLTVPTANQRKALEKLLAEQKIPHPPTTESG